VLVSVALLLLGAASTGAWGDLQLAATGNHATAPGNVISWGGSGTISLSGFLHHRLVEDDAPLSLQPYLQRTGAIEGTVSANGFSTDSPSYLEPYHGTTLGGSVAVDAYPTEVLTLWASAAFFRSKTGGGFGGPGTEYLLPRLELAPGVRFGDTRGSVGYTWAPTIINGTYDGRGLGELFLRINSVIGRRVSLSLLGALILSGARGSLSLVVFPTRRVGLGGGFEYAEGAIYFDRHDVYRQWQAWGNLILWLGRTWALGLEYRFLHSAPTTGLSGSPMDTHRIALSFSFRLD
jgi:hypothetical protein